jgi:hypothetical protein
VPIPAMALTGASRGHVSWAEGPVPPIRTAAVGCVRTRFAPPVRLWAGRAACPRIAVWALSATRACVGPAKPMRPPARLPRSAVRIFATWANAEPAWGRAPHAFQARPAVPEPAPGESVLANPRVLRARRPRTAAVSCAKAADANAIRPGKPAERPRTVVVAYSAAPSGRAARWPEVLVPPTRTAAKTPRIKPGTGECVAGKCCNAKGSVCVSNSSSACCGGSSVRCVPGISGGSTTYCGCGPPGVQCEWDRDCCIGGCKAGRCGCGASGADSFGLPDGCADCCSHACASNSTICL